MIPPRAAARRLVREHATNNPVVIAGRLGVSVDYVTLKGTEDLGWIVRLRRRYLIVINMAAHELWTSVRFTVAHELGHYVCHRHLPTWLGMDSQDEEPAWMNRQANEFASELLMPAPAARQVVWAALSRREDPARALARAFEVSRRAAEIRVRELGFAPASAD